MSQHHEMQRLADLWHHTARVLWLSESNPLWADGSAVEKDLARDMLIASKAFLENPKSSPGNACDCDPRCSENTAVA